jgi:hypothetical protein
MVTGLELNESASNEIHRRMPRRWETANIKHFNVVIFSYKNATKY